MSSRPSKKWSRWLAGTLILFAGGCGRDVKSQEITDAGLPILDRIEGRILRAKTLRIGVTGKNDLGLEMDGTLVADDRNRFRIEMRVGYASTLKRPFAIVCDGIKVEFSGNVGNAKAYEAPPDLGRDLRRVLVRAGLLNAAHWLGSPKSKDAALPLATNPRIFHKWSLRVRYDLVMEPGEDGVEILLEVDNDTLAPQNRKSVQMEEEYSTFEMNGAVADSEFKLD